MFKKIALCVAALVMVCGVAVINASAAGPETITFDTAKKGGTKVAFGHKAHQGMMDCGQCHHTKKADGTQGPYVAGKEAKCATCHEVGKPSDNVHKNCKGCHTAGHNGKKGPTGCNDCHKK